MRKPSKADVFEQTKGRFFCLARVKDKRTVPASTPASTDFRLFHPDFSHKNLCACLPHFLCWKACAQAAEAEHSKTPENKAFSGVLVETTGVALSSHF